MTFPKGPQSLAFLLRRSKASRQGACVASRSSDKRQIFAAYSKIYRAQDTSVLSPPLDRILRQSAAFAAALCLLSPGALAKSGDAAPAPELDLHAHLFFYEGAGVSLVGDFSTPIHASSWRARIGSKANAKSLLPSGSGVIVVTLYSHPLFLPSLAGSQRDSIRAQLLAVRRLLEQDPGVGLARSPAELRAIVGRGRRAIVLSIEGASGVLDTEGDLQEFIDRGGVRIVTLLHFSNDWIGGSALMGGLSALLVAPLNWLDSMLHRHLAEEPGAGSLPLNRLGLRPEGRVLVSRLLARHVWIDLSHSGDLAQQEVFPMLEAAGQPLLYTHTVLRRYYRAERAVSASQLARVARTRGIVGILPSEDMLRGTPELAMPDCDGGVASLARQLEEAAAVAGADGVSLGSDINAPLNFIGPACAKGGRSLDPRGFWNYGSLGQLREELRHRGVRALADPAATYRRFIRAWERVSP